jgi:uncharacterized protein (DUF1800 family)
MQSFAYIFSINLSGEDSLMKLSKIESSDASNAEILHILNRLSFGSRPGDLEAVKSIGIEAYIQSQLKPDSIAQPQSLTQQLDSLETLKMTPAAIAQEYSPPVQQQQGQKLTPDMRKEVRQKSRRTLDQAVQGRLLRSLYSNRQLEEVLVDFWYNHFNVFSGKGLTRIFVGSYEEQAIRPHVLGKFRSLLDATAKHPAMLFYLDNWQNTAPNSPGARGRYKGLNENYARELMELHTLGVNGGYTQQDVITLARILTGWGFPRPRQGAGNGSGFYFDTTRHDSSDKVFLGQTIKGGAIEEGEKALDILASHPATARHISYKLAQYFVADDPPISLIDQLAKRFQETDGDIREVLNVLVHSSEFLNPKYYNVKLKTPYQYVISALRATDTSLQDFRSITGVLNQLGMPLYGCQTPDGYKNTQTAWLNPDGVIRRISWTTALANGRFAGSKAVEAQQLEKTLGNNFSSNTQQAIAKNPDSLKAALMLGSPEFMKH